MSGFLALDAVFKVNHLAHAGNEVQLEPHICCFLDKGMMLYKHVLCIRLLLPSALDTRWKRHIATQLPLQALILPLLLVWGGTKFQQGSMERLFPAP